MLAAVVAAALLFAAVAAWQWQRCRRQETEIAALRAEQAATVEKLAADAERLRRALDEAERAHATAAAEAARWREVLERLPVPIWTRDETAAMRWHNPAYAATAGVDPAASGPPPEIENALAPGSAKAMAQRAQAEGTEQSQTRYYVVDGQRRALQIHELGVPAGGIGYATDVTEREDLRAELKRLVDAQAQILEYFSTAIAIFGPDRRLSYFNSAFARLWRLDEDWLSTQPAHLEVIDAMRDNRLLPEQADYRAYRAGIAALYTDLLEASEGLEYLPDGRVLRRVISPHPFGGLLFFYEDVTDRLALERSYNTLIAVQREILDHLYEGVALFGSDGRLKLFNPTYQQIWDLDRELLKQEPHVSEIVDSVQPLFARYRNWPGLRDRLVAQVTERRNQAGRVEAARGRLVDFAGLPLPDGNMLYTYLDVTDSVMIERALRERNEALETADRLKSEFIANVSYELRTPLNVIIGFSEILFAEYFGSLNPRQKEYADGILKSSKQLLALINDILDLATIEAGRLELEPRRFDLREAMGAVATLAREPARARGVQLELTCPSDIGDIYADEARIKQAVFNLASNAIKFTPGGGRVEIGAARGAGEVRLWVADTGVGIAEEERALVFERFQRGRRARQLGAGVGLGLSLVRSFIEMHGGRIELDSKVGQGTRITCILPVDDSVTAAAGE